MTSRNGTARPVAHRRAERPARDRTEPLARDHHIPLRRQLAASLEAAIRDGHLKAGAHLPSSRDMAARLGVHRSTVTAAFACLRRRGWVSGGPGGRMRVRRPDAGSPALAGTRADSGGSLLRDATRPRRGGASSDPMPWGSLDDLAAAGVLGLLAEARRHGIRRDRAIASLESAVRSLSCPAAEAVRPILLAEPRPGLRAALVAELERCFRTRVAAVSHPARLERLSLAGPVLLRAGLAARFDDAGRELIPLRLAGGTRERGIARRSVRTGLVTLVSASGAIRRYAAELAAREFGRGISFAAVDPDDASGMIRLVAASRLVFFDEASRERFPPTRLPVLPIRLLDEPSLGRLGAYLGLPAARGRGT